MGRLLVFDSYDSFTFNLVHFVRELGEKDIDVCRNDKITLDEVGRYQKILLSPGPGIPREAGIMPELITKYCRERSILGVCLGHQGIAEAFGGTLHNLEQVVHGKATTVHILTDDVLFQNIPQTFRGGRYHSWIVEKDTLPECLTITAESEDGEIMALSHKEYDIRGLQFHPESILTEHGKDILRNWLGA